MLTIHTEELFDYSRNTLIDTATFPLGKSHAKLFTAVAPNGIKLSFPSSLIELPFEPLADPLPFNDTADAMEWSSSVTQTPKKKRKKDEAITSPMPVTPKSKRPRY